MKDLNLTQLTDGSYLLNCQQHYQLEPGGPISIISGDAIITIRYDFEHKETYLQIEHPTCDTDTILFDEETGDNEYNLHGSQEPGDVACVFGLSDDAQALESVYGPDDY